MRHMGLLSGEELERRLRGDVGDWKAEALAAAIKPDHGFVDSSPPLLWLISVMAVRSGYPKSFAKPFVLGYLSFCQLLDPLRLRQVLLSRTYGIAYSPSKMLMQGS